MSTLTSTVIEVATAVPTAIPDVVNDELYSSWALFLLTLLLISALLMSYFLQSRQIRTVHETVVSIVAGLFVGLVIRLSPGHTIQEMVTFKHTLFFNLLLPPIILNAGYSLKEGAFFKHLPIILTFAFAGTFISAVSLGLIVWLFALLPLTPLHVNFVQCLIFGSTLSATDPVTILSIFNAYRVDPKLFSIVFGESLLNDAVAIVMYETLTTLAKDDAYSASHVWYPSSVLHGIGIFFISFSESTILGIAFALIASLLLKHTNLGRYPQIESCLVLLIAYCAYLFANGLQKSGIVTLLFCGVTMKHYAYHNMSTRTQKTTRYMFAVLAKLSENFIFLYLGITLFTQDVTEFKLLFIPVAILAACASRYLAVFPLSQLLNWASGARQQNKPLPLPHSYQIMLFWSGLRGAVGVALAAGFTGTDAAVLKTTVLIVVVVTVMFFGATTSRMLQVVRIRIGHTEHQDESTDDEYELPNDEITQASSRTGHFVLAPYDRESANSSHSASQEDLSLPQRVINLPSMIFKDGQWFNALDQQYLIPIFSNTSASRKYQAKRTIRRGQREDALPEEQPLTADNEVGLTESVKTLYHLIRD